MTRLSKKQLQQRAASQRAQSVLTEKKNIMDTASNLVNLNEQLQLAYQRIKELETMLFELQTAHYKLETNLVKVQEIKCTLKSEVQSLKIKHKKTYHELRMARQTQQRSLIKQNILKSQAEILRAAAKNTNSEFQAQSKQAAHAISALTKINDDLRSELSDSLSDWRDQIDNIKFRLERSTKALKESRKEVTRLTKSNNRAAAVKVRSVASAKAMVVKSMSYHHLMQKGVFTEKTRSVVRLLIKAGCSAQYINEVISTVLRSAGIEPVGNISRTSVRRIVREGFVAAQIQLGHEMEIAPSMTFSADGTGHRSINYNSRHIHLLAETYDPENKDDGSPQANSRVTRFLGIRPSCDNSSNESILDWKATISSITDLYNRSPFGKRSSRGIFQLIDALIKLTGMNSDHCSKEKKDAQKMEELKHWAVNQRLGEEALLEKSVSEVHDLYKDAEKVMIKKAGGNAKWLTLSSDIQAAKQAQMIEGVVAELGKEAYSMLSEAEQRALHLFIWAGCGCHKDLNTVRGGYKSMAQYWIDNGLDGPVLLSNCDNDPVLHERDEALANGDDTTPAQDRALSQTTGGALKMAEIAGCLLNHKDDKKGHHDLFRWWWGEHVGFPFTFPDTSNNRFLSYCDAAAALILYKDKFIQFLDHLRDTKQNGKLNHMESNFWKALHCDRTQSELAVLVLYAESISYPYLRAIRAPGNTLNMLDLGPLHIKVGDHISHIISNPDLLLNSNTPLEHSALNGEQWQNPKAIQHIQTLSTNLPHLRQLLLAFFGGASTTWSRFISEFAPGGLIDEATTEERELAWLPATNDENEGALGSFRHMMCRQPQLSLITHNALAMFFRNNTQAFMDSKFTEEEDYRFLHQVAREMRGEDKKMRQQIIQFRDKKQAQKHSRREKKAAKAAETKALLAQTKLELDPSVAGSLKGKALALQIKLFQEKGAPGLTHISSLSADQKREALVLAISKIDTGEWAIGNSGSDDSEDDSEVSLSESEADSSVD